MHAVLLKHCAAHGFCAEERELSLWELVVSTVRCWCRPEGDLMYRPDGAARTAAAVPSSGKKKK
jgi:hypothetical protein